MWTCPSTPTLRPLWPLAALAVIGALVAGCHAPAARTDGPARDGPLYAQRRHDVLVDVAPGDAGVWPWGEREQAFAWTPPAPGAEPVWTCESPVLRPAAPFFAALLSANVDAPPGAAFALELRVGRGEWWSGWLRVMTWGDAPAAAALGAPVREARDDRGRPAARIDVDELVSTLLFDRAQYRLLAVGGEGGPPVTVHRVALCTSAPEWRWSPPEGPGGPAFRTPVPFRSQRTPEPALAGRLCSPTSVTMVAAYAGSRATVHDVAARVYDPEHDLYGHWPRNVQAGFTLGLPGLLARLERWDQAETLLRSGRIIVASIRAETPGALRGAPYATSGGHLIVLTGLDEGGDVLVNDPAVGDAAAGMLTYRREDLTRVWLQATDGTCYVFRPRPPAEAAP